MNATLRRVLVLALFVSISVLAFFGARHWQASQGDWNRLAPPADCDLGQGPCQHPVAGGWVTFSMLPAGIPLMQPLSLRLVAKDLEADAVSVEIRGLNMDMGLNRIRMESQGQGVWSGATILPICSQRSMEWEAAVRLEMDERLEVPFLFRTTR